jgi:hypothetical protein
VEGQVLTVINQSDRVAADASIGLRIPAAGGVGQLLYLGPKPGGGAITAGWTMLSVRNP